jgi:broad specificity phosphatase PhoE
VAHVYTSTLARAVQTAEIVAASLDIGVTTRLGLREFDAGYLAERPHDLDPVLAVYDRWIGGDLGARVPDGESAAELVARLRTVLEEIAAGHPGETVLVVSHGGTLRIGLPALCRMDVEPAELENTATVEVRAEAGGRVCVRWGS